MHLCMCACEGAPRILGCCLASFLATPAPEAIARGSWENHLAVCPYSSVECADCGAAVLRSQMPPSLAGRGMSDHGNSVLWLVTTTQSF